MKTFAKFVFVVFAILLAAGYYYGLGLTGGSRCGSQVNYAIGDIDPRFNLNREAVVDLSAEAGGVWNQALGEELFVYDESSPIKINFVYDERQRDRDMIMQKINELNLEYENLTEFGNEINKQVAEFERAMRDFNADVERWNSKGGAPSGVYSTLKNRERRLERERAHINELINAYNNTQIEYDLGQDNIDDIVMQKNNTIEEAGVLISNGPGAADVINIFVYDGDDSLRYLLAHELGHIKAGHVKENDYSIMSSVLSDSQLENLQPTPEDIALVSTCNKEIN